MWAFAQNEDPDRCCAVHGSSWEKAMYLSMRSSILGSRDVGISRRWGEGRATLAIFGDVFLMSNLQQYRGGPRSGRNPLVPRIDECITVLSDFEGSQE